VEIPQKLPSYIGSWHRSVDFRYTSMRFQRDRSAVPWRINVHQTDIGLGAEIIDPFELYGDIATALLELRRLEQTGRWHCGVEVRFWQEYAADSTGRSWPNPSVYPYFLCPFPLMSDAGGSGRR
jgi:hypothetical protein